MGGHNSDFRKNPAKKEFWGGNPFTFPLKHFCDTTLQSNLGCCFCFFFFLLLQGGKKEAKNFLIYEWGCIYKDKCHTNYRPQLGWLLKNKMHLACIQPLTKCDFHLETENGCHQKCSRRRERHPSLTFFFFCFFMKHLKDIQKKSRLCYKCVSGGCGRGAEAAFITWLHIVMRMRRGESEQRKPDLRVEFF